MEMTLQLQRPLDCKGAANIFTLFRNMPTIGNFSVSLESKGLIRIRTMAHMRATSDYSRRRPRRSAIPKTKFSAPKGFAPRTPVGKKTRKRDPHHEEEQSISSQSSKNFLSTKQLSEVVADGKAESSGSDSIVKLSSNVMRKTKALDEVEESAQGKNYIELLEELPNGEDLGDEMGTRMLKKVVPNPEDFEKGRLSGKNSKLEKMTEFSSHEGISTKVEDHIEQVLTKDNAVAVSLQEDVAAIVEVTSQQDVQIEIHDVSLAKLKFEKDGQVLRKLLDLVEENFSSGRKFFLFPAIVRAGQVIDVFFNRSLSLLANEPDVLIKGAFNDWRWSAFTEKMHKNDLQGDWWSCKIYVPREAYRIDFVFFNGLEVYENNNLKDFSVAVVGGMNETLFDDFLLEELQKRLEKLAAEQVEKDRKAEELRYIEAKKTATEVDRAQARLEVEKRQEICQRVMRLAVKSVQGLWHTEPVLFKGENRIRLYYNRKSRPLEYSKDLWIHGGYNNWMDGLCIVERLIKSVEKDGDWWYADVNVPDNALVLDWVFADGPPQQAKVYDNNKNHDFHASFSKFSEETYWMEEETRIFMVLQEERRLKEEAELNKTEKLVRMKAETKERTLKRFLLSQKHVVYAEPTVVHAGKVVKVFYNPSSTVLSGKSVVWFRCSFNRWTHRNGPLSPQKMMPISNGKHLQAIVKVPLDAYIMDFVFSEREDGGIYDNKNGMDYHIPVTGGVAKEPPMHIIQIAIEMAPIAKVGGLGDVVTSLSRAVQDLGHKVDIILPKYDCLKLNHVKDFHYHQAFHFSGTEIKVWHGRVEGLSVYFLEPQNGMFWVGCIYGRNNDGDRFGFFCHAALEFLLQSEICPDIFHCHDWSSAPVAWLFKEHYRHYGLSKARVIFTIHNLEFGIHQIGKAMTYSDKATTVSSTYSKEVSGNRVISPHRYKFHGILNGIDPDIWDPYNDSYIPVSYTSENVIEGKKAAKVALQQRLGLKKSDCPLVGIITRLTAQKGIHLIKHAIWRTLDRNGQLVLLGSAPDPRIQNDFVNLANQLHSSHGGCIRLCLTYDEPLSHMIYAGSDFILVPSIFEPCGLTQLVAMRYGSIPVVRKTGGLYDTIFDVDHDKERAQSVGLEPNGFNFEDADSGGVDYALNRAISAWYESREWFNQLCKRVMEQDWSWNRPALDYIELYYAARKEDN